MKSPLAAKRFFLGLLAISAGLLAMVLAPFAQALFMAAVLAGVLWGLVGAFSGEAVQGYPMFFG